MEHHRQARAVQRDQRLRKAVPRHGLRDVLNQFPAPGVRGTPFAGLLVRRVVVQALPVGKLLRRRHERLGVEQLSTGGQLAGEETLVAADFQPERDRHVGALDADARRLAGGQRFDGCVLHPAPQLADRWVRLPPLVDDDRQILLFQALAQGAGVDQPGRAAPIAAAENGDLSALAQVGVLPVLFDGHAEHLRSHGAVDVFSGAECVQHPLFARQPGHHARLDGAVVRHGVQLARRRDQRGPDQLGERVGHAAPAEADHLDVPVQHQAPRVVQSVQVILGQVLGLDDPPGPAAGPARAIVGHHAPHPSVVTGRGRQRVVLFRRRLADQLPDFQHALHLRVVDAGLQQLRDRGFPEIGHLLVHFLVQPCHQLLRALGVLQPGERPRLLHQLRLLCLAHGDGAVHQRPVDAGAADIALRGQLPQALLAFGHRPAGQTALDGALRLHVLPAVGLEQLPLFRLVLGPDAPRLRVRPVGLLGNAEFPDQRRPDAHFPFVRRQAQRLAHGRQGSRIAAIVGVGHGAMPPGERDRRPSVPRQPRVDAVVLERGVIGVQPVVGVVQVMEEFLQGDVVAALAL